MAVNKYICRICFTDQTCHECRDWESTYVATATAWAGDFPNNLSFNGTHSSNSTINTETRKAILSLLTKEELLMILNRVMDNGT